MDQNKVNLGCIVSKMFTVCSVSKIITVCIVSKIITVYIVSKIITVCIVSKIITVRIVSKIITVCIVSRILSGCIVSRIFTVCIVSKIFTETLQCSKQSLVIIEVKLLAIQIIALKGLKVHCIAQHTADTSKPPNILASLLTPVRDDFKGSSEVFVVIRQPLQQGHVVLQLHLHPRLLVHEMRLVLLLSRVQKQNLLLARGVILQSDSLNIQVFPANKSLHCTHLQGLEGVIHSEAVLSGVLRDFVKIAADQLLLLDELDVVQALGGQLDSLVESILPSVANIHRLDDLGLQPLVEHVGLAQLSFEICGSSHDQSGYVGQS